MRKQRGLHSAPAVVGRRRDAAERATRTCRGLFDAIRGLGCARASTAACSSTRSATRARDKLTGVQPWALWPAARRAGAWPRRDATARARSRWMLSVLCLGVLPVFGCGDEPPPWSGFALFPDDAGLLDFGSGSSPDPTTDPKVASLDVGASDTVQRTAGDAAVAHSPSESPASPMAARSAPSVGSAPGAGAPLAGSGAGTEAAPVRSSDGDAEASMPERWPMVVWDAGTLWSGRSAWLRSRGDAGMPAAGASAPVAAGSSESAAGEPSVPVLVDEGGVVDDADGGTG